MSRVGSTKALPIIIAFAVRAGVSPPELLLAAGLDPSIFADPDASVPDWQELRLWDEAVRLSGDQDFGLHLAEWVSQSPEDHFDVLAFALRSCATLGEAYTRMGRYIRLIHQGAYFSLEVDEDLARLGHGLCDDLVAPRQPMEGMLTMALLHGRRAIGEEFAPRTVCFAHSSPAGVSEQERVFRCPVYYACPRNELVLDRALLDRPQRHADPQLLAVLDRRLEGFLSRLPEDPSLSGRVKHRVLYELPDREPTVRSIAKRLNMSPRSLQRGLQAERTSFAAVLADLRRDLALRYLQDPRITISEVAFLLGFSEVSAFHRAFKRWTGTTPAEHRRAPMR